MQRICQYLKMCLDGHCSRSVYAAGDSVLCLSFRPSVRPSARVAGVRGRRAVCNANGCLARDSNDLIRSLYTGFQSVCVIVYDVLLQ